MQSARLEFIEQLQRLIAGMIAISPAGHKLSLIGGFRYRLMSRSCRTSADIDYHWDGDLEQKQDELAELLSRRLLPEVQRLFGYDGRVQKATGPDSDSPFVKTVDVALYRTTDRPDRIEIPVEITSIPCADEPIVRTVAGKVILTVSDPDMIESKVIALFSRIFIAERDLVDLFLFQDQFATDSARRLREKFNKLGIAPGTLAERVRSMEAGRVQHVRAVDAIIEEQIENAVAANLRAAGGGGMIVDAVIQLLKTKLGMGAQP